MYEVCTNDFYQDMWAMKQEFDLASYAKSSPFYDATNKKVVGKFNDEASGQSISEFVRLKPKIFSYQTLHDPSNGQADFTTKKRAKGIQWAAVVKRRHDESNEQLNPPEDTDVANRRISSKLHQL